MFPLSMERGGGVLLINQAVPLGPRGDIPRDLFVSRRLNPFPQRIHSVLPGLRAGLQLWREMPILL